MAESQVRAGSTRFQGEPPPASGPSRERPDRPAAISLTFARLAEVNRQRAGRWHPGFPGPDAEWTGADWSNAMQGETGELAEVAAALLMVRLSAASGLVGNTVKKIRRYECDLIGALDPPEAELRAKLAEEIADVICYADLLATYYGIDVASAVAAKFNAVSERQGFPERLR